MSYYNGDMKPPNTLPENAKITVAIDDPAFARFWVTVQGHTEALDCRPDSVVTAICAWIEKCSTRGEKHK